MKKIKQSNISITNVNKFFKRIKVCGVTIIERLDWMDESDGGLSKKHILDSLIPADETYYLSDTSITDNNGMFTGETARQTLTLTEINDGAEPTGFHPVSELVIKNGEYSKKAMRGSW